MTDPGSRAPTRRSRRRFTPCCFWEARGASDGGKLLLRLEFRQRLLDRRLDRRRSLLPRQLLERILLRSLFRGVAEKERGRLAHAPLAGGLRVLLRGEAHVGEPFVVFHQRPV